MEDGSAPRLKMDSGRLIMRSWVVGTVAWTRICNTSLFQYRVNNQNNVSTNNHLHSAGYQADSRTDRKQFKPLKYYDKG
ncbi:MAG: hypothetical protein QXE67_03915, partial [Nitrososphaerota archaeon]